MVLPLEPIRAYLTLKFPGLLNTPFSIDSPVTNQYNCIAWAAGRDDQWWWPIGRYRPDGVIRDESIEAFVTAFRALSYEPCDTNEHEMGMQKVAIYGHSRDRVLHAARQLPSGAWTSKLGGGWDITHNLFAIEGVEYGKVLQLLRRSEGGLHHAS